MNKLLVRSKRFVQSNASTILTCVGGVGVVATAVMAVRATPKALHVIEKAEEQKGEKLTKLEVARVAAPAYIPAVLVGASTIACIFGANVLNKRQQAGLMSAYAILDRSYKDYKEKVQEVYGRDGHEEVRDEIAQDRYEVADIAVSPGKTLFYDEFIGEYFESTIEEVQKAQYELNREVQMSGFYSLVDYYEMLGIEYDDGGSLGWSEGGNMARYWQAWVDFGHTKTVIDDGSEDGVDCIIVTMWQEPYFEYENY